MAEPAPRSSDGASLDAAVTGLCDRCHGPPSVDTDLALRSRRGRIHATRAALARDGLPRCQRGISATRVGFRFLELVPRLGNRRQPDFLRYAMAHRRRLADECHHDARGRGVCDWTLDFFGDRRPGRYRRIATTATPEPGCDTLGIARETRCDAGARATVLETLESGPFYARSLVRTRAEGREWTAFHESVSLRRFAARWVQALLPVRLPRRPLR